jgi:hypothetical protein
MTSDLRRFYRCSLTGERASGVLVVRHRRYPCTVRNRSIGGFGIETPHDPAVAQTGSAELECAEGTFAVEVVHVSLVNGQLQLGLTEQGVSQSKRAWTTGRIRGWSLVLGTLAVLFVFATALLAFHAEQAEIWLQSSGHLEVAGQPPGDSQAVRR